jgi:hypothetical protein
MKFEHFKCPLGAAKKLYGRSSQCRLVVSVKHLSVTNCDQRLGLRTRHDHPIVRVEKLSTAGAGLCLIAEKANENAVLIDQLLEARIAHFQSPFT